MKKYLTKTICCFMMILLILPLCSCYKYREGKYYADKNNYITDVAVVKNILFNKDTGNIHFWLDEYDDSFQDSNFIVTGKSVLTVQENDIFEKIPLGSEMEYISAPRYFGDGYCMPIVAISVDGEEILSFEEGYKNLMALY